MPDDAHKHRPARLWLGLLLSALSGLLLYLAFPPADVGPVAFVAFVPLMVAVGRAGGYGTAALCGLVAGLTTCVPAFAWVRSVALSGWLALSLYVGLYTVVAGVVFRYLQRRFGAWWPLLGAASWVGLEVARAHLGPGFPWLFAGYTQHRFLPLVQAAALGGVYAVSFIVLLVNAALAGLFARRAPVAARVGVLVLTALVLGGAALGGRAAMERVELRDGPVVGVVQQNVPRLVSQIFDKAETARQIYREMGDELARAAGLTRRLQGSGVRLVCWPETTVQIGLNVAPGLFTHEPDRAYATQVLDDLRTLGGLLDSYLLVGAPTYMARSVGYIEQPIYGTAGEGFGNSAVLVTPAGRFVDRYDKIRLVPFGEYIPLRKIFPFLQVFTPMTREVTPGTQEVIFSLPPRAGGRPVRFAALICYEDVFAGLCADFRRKGADFLVNLTDEGWYDIPGELGQHLAMAVFRAVETRTTVVRAANTGISCFIDPRGRVYARLERHTADALSAPLRLNSRITPYVRYGDVFGVLCLMLSIALPPLLAAARRQ